MPLWNDCPEFVQFLFWVAVIGGGGYVLRLLNKFVHSRAVRERR